MELLAHVLLFALDVYFWIIIVSVIMSWLIVFEVINAHNQKTKNLLRLLERATEPVYKPIRKYIPSIGGIDISPIIVIFGIYLLSDLISRFLYRGLLY